MIGPRRDPAIKPAATIEALHADVEYLLEAYKLFVDQINKEDTLINHRMTWAISVNGGLLAILGVLYKELSEKHPQSVGYIVFWICLMGGFVSFAILGSVRAADRQLYKIKTMYKNAWDPQFVKLNLTPPFAHDRPSGDGPLLVAEPRFWWPHWVLIVSMAVWLLIFLVLR